MTLVIVSVTRRGLVVLGDTAVSTGKKAANGAAKVQFHRERRVAFAVWGEPSILRDIGGRIQIDRLLHTFIEEAPLVPQDSIEDVSGMLSAYLRIPFERHRRMTMYPEVKEPWGQYCFGVYVAGYDEDVEAPTVRVVTLGTNTLRAGPPRVVMPEDGLRVIAGQLPYGVSRRYWYGGTKQERQIAEAVFEESAKCVDDSAYRQDPAAAEWGLLSWVIQETSRRLSAAGGIASVNQLVRGVRFDSDTVFTQETQELCDWIHELGT